MVDARRLAALLQRLAAEVEALEHLRTWSEEDLLADALALPAAKYHFVVAIEAAIDAGEHVIASETLRAPRDYADVFAVLAEQGWVDDELADRLGQTARFRNLLVHGYATVDDRRVVAALQDDLDDLSTYRRRLAAAASDAS